MLILLNTGLPIAIAVGFSSMIVGFIMSGPVALEKLGWTTFQTVFQAAWTPLPLFTFIGCLIAQTKIGEDLFRAARAWLSRLPGGLIVASIFSQAGMAAVLGASQPTIMAVGPVSQPELRRYNYDRKLSLGSLTCGGVLGPLIPPSGTAIIISGLAGQSVPLGQLLMAGIIPGILLAVMLSLVPIVRCARNPELGPRPTGITWGERFSSLRRVWPVAVTFFAILGSIFFGIATATEAGGVGALITLVVATIVYRAGWREIKNALVETVSINAQIMFILVGAGFFSYVVGSSALGRDLAALVSNFGSPILGVIAIMAALLILGCLIDGMTIMMITIPIFFPLIQALGLNPLWFAVLFEVNMEIGLVTPPMGINFFLVRNVFKINAGELFWGVLPFMVMCILFLFVLVIFPQITTWLPSLMLG
jgi:tripartite ATP-independent transporter DctM subunit